MQSARANFTSASSHRARLKSDLKFIAAVNIEAVGGWIPVTGYREKKKAKEGRAETKIVRLYAQGKEATRLVFVKDFSKALFLKVVINQNAADLSITATRYHVNHDGEEEEKDVGNVDVDVDVSVAGFVLTRPLEGIH